MSPITKVGVIGAGQMGSGIAFVAALRARCSQVLLHDPNPTQLAAGLKHIKAILDKDAGKGKITKDDAGEAFERIKGVGAEGIEEMERAGVQMVVEAAPENLELKRSIFSNLAKRLNPDTILASNTSSISITKIAASTIPSGVGAASEEAKRAAGRVVGLHFFNPVPVMKLVELISALQTTPETLDQARQFAIACGKEVTTSQDVPGFVSNALLMPFINEAIMCLDAGTATRDDIDKTLKLGMNHPMGPLQLADFIGLDTCLAIQKVLYEGTGDSKYRPSILLERMVDAGWVGKKGGKGFYDY